MESLTKEIFTSYGRIRYSLVCALDANNKIAQYILQYELSIRKKDGSLEVIVNEGTSVHPSKINECLGDLKLNLKQATLEKSPDFDNWLETIIPFQL